MFDNEASIYYYGASSNSHRNLMAPYLLQWFAIMHAKSIWSNMYDFLWIASPNEIESHLAGVTDFKKKFTQDIREVSTSFIWIRKKVIYYIIQFLRKITR